MASITKCKKNVYFVNYSKHTHLMNKYSITLHCMSERWTLFESFAVHVTIAKHWCLKFLYNTYKMCVHLYGPTVLLVPLDASDLELCDS